MNTSTGETLSHIMTPITTNDKNTIRKMIDREDIMKKRGHSCFEWAQLIATICIPIIIAIYTIIENNSNISIAADNRRKDVEIAEQSREKDRTLATDQQQENILVEYQTFLARLILDNGMDLEKSPNAKVVGKFMTLTALYQLDIRRKNILIRSLYDANLITVKEKMSKTEKSILSLGVVDLRDITFGSPRNSPDEYPINYYIHWNYLWLPDAILTNASFRHTILECATFTSARMDSVDLSFAMQQMLDCCDSFCDSGTDFTNASLVNASLYNANFLHADFSSANLTFANMRGFYCQKCIFSHTILIQADLSFSYFHYSFLLDQLPVDFTGVKLKQAIIYGAYFRSIKFQNSDWSNAQLSQIILRNCAIINTTMDNCSFVKSTIQESIFRNVMLYTINLSNAILYNVTFNNSNMHNGNLNFIKCMYCIFINVSFEGVVFKNALLRYSNFHNCRINISQLDEATDLFGSTLYNGTDAITLGTTAQFSDQIIYNIRVQTGDEFQAGTDADIYLKIFGEKNYTDKIQLKSTDHTLNQFQKGRIDEFIYEFDDLGKVHLFFQITFQLSINYF
jgi:uncharacterized protein YjbI with pentapeptide repeats